MQIEFDINGDIITNVSFLGGCPGNLAAISRVVEGKTVKQIEEWCEKYGVKLTTTYVETDEYPAGTIFEQSQKADDNVMNGQSLTIKIAEEVSDNGVEDQVD